MCFAKQHEAVPDHATVQLEHCVAALLSGPAGIKTKVGGGCPLPALQAGARRWQCSGACEEAPLLHVTHPL